MTVRGQVAAGLVAQLLGQVLTGWALVAHLVDIPSASVWVAGPLAVAVLVPFRHDGTPRDRAIGNFAAAYLVVGMLVWELLAGSVDGILGGTTGLTAPFTLLTLAGSVLFSGAGVAFWLLREGRSS